MLRRYHKKGEKIWKGEMYPSAEWVEEQLNQLNGRAETCEGES